MPKNGFPILTAKNGFQKLNLHPKKHVFKKKYPFFNVNLLVDFPNNYSKNHSHNL